MYFLNIVFQVNFHLMKPLISEIGFAHSCNVALYICKNVSDYYAFCKNTQ